MELTDAEREDYANEDIPLPEVGAEPAPFEDVGPVVEPAQAEPGETEEATAREEPPEAGGEAAPEGAEREPATELTPEQIAEAEKAAAEWRPASMNRNANRAEEYP